MKHTLLFGGDALGGGGLKSFRLDRSASAVYCQEWCDFEEKSFKDQPPPVAEQQARVQARTGIDLIVQDARRYRLPGRAIAGRTGGRPTASGAR